MGSRGGPAGPPTDETADLLALRKKLLEKKARLDQMLRQAGGGAPVASTGGKNGGGKGSQRYVFSRVIRHRTIAHPRRARFSGACANRFFFPNQPFPLRRRRPLAPISHAPPPQATGRSRTIPRDAPDGVHPQLRPVRPGQRDERRRRTDRGRVRVLRRRGCVLVSPSSLARLTALGVGAPHATPGVLVRPRARPGGERHGQPRAGPGGGAVEAAARTSRTRARR